WLPPKCQTPPAATNDPHVSNSPLLNASSAARARPAIGCSATATVRDKPRGGHYKRLPRKRRGHVTRAHWFHLSAVFLPCPELFARALVTSCAVRSSGT